MDAPKVCPACNQPVDPDDPDTVHATKTAYVGFVEQPGMTPHTTDRDFHGSCFDSHRTGWQRKP